MKSKSAEKIKLTSYDDLFGSSEVTAEEKIVSVPIRLFQHLQRPSIPGIG